MKTILIVLALTLFYSTSFAEQIYTYKDKDGNTVISNTPVPDKYKPKAKQIEAYTPLAPGEVARRQVQEEYNKKKKARDKIEDDRKIAETKYWESERRRKEEREKEAKRRREEADENLKRAIKEQKSRDFFNSKL